MSDLTREDIADLVRQYGRECANAVMSFRAADPDLDAVLDPICAELVEAERTIQRARALVPDWQANGNSRPLGDMSASAWHAAAIQLLRALDGAA